MESYLTLSGDTNPLHSDTEIAEKMGFARIPVPGMLIMAYFSQILADWQCNHTAHKLGAKFLRPIFLDGELKISGTVVSVKPESCQAVIRLKAEQDGKIGAIGEAEINYDRP